MLPDVASQQCYAINRKLKAMQRQVESDQVIASRMVRKENGLYNTVSIILSIQVITWIRQDSNTVSIKTLQLRNRFSERTPINQYIENYGQ